MTTTAPTEAPASPQAPPAAPDTKPERQIEPGQPAPGPGPRALPPLHECPGAVGDFAKLEHVLGVELNYLWYHRHPDQPADKVATNLIGLALSGGGIRSATTNLGVLQALSKMQILPLVDYVSTVSGGGYIGACLSSLLSLKKSAVGGGPTAWGKAATRPEEPYLARASGESPAFSTEWDEFPFRAERHTRDGKYDRRGALTTALVAHLRMHGNFLIARKGLLKRETMRSVGHLLTGIVYHLVLFLLTLACVAAAYLALATSVAPGLPRALGLPDTAPTQAIAVPPIDTAGDTTRTRSYTSACPGPGCREEQRIALRPPTLVERVARNFRALGVPLGAAWDDWDGPGDSLPTILRPLGWALLAGMTAALLVFLLIRLPYGRYLGGALTAPSEPKIGESGEDIFERRLLWGVVAFLAVGLLATVLGLHTLYHRRIVAESSVRLRGAEQLVWLLIPLAFVVGARVATFLVAALWLPNRDGTWTRRMRSIWGGVQAITIYGWWLTLLLAVLPFVMYAVRDNRIGVSLGAIGSLVAARLLVARGPAGTPSRFALPLGLRRFLLAIAVALVILLGVLAFGALLAGRGEVRRDALIVAGATAVALFIFGRFVNNNRLSPHYFYRDRLAETYLLSELPDEDGRMHVFRDAMEMPLHVLHGEPAAPKDKVPAPEWRNPAPYHLISAAINLAGSRDLTRKDRKSGYWLFSKLYCGSTHTGFRPTACYRGGETKLARAVAISGAAVGSAMGSGTFFAQAFATVLFNVRLGYWLDNPRHTRSVRRPRLHLWPRYLKYLRKEVLMDTKEDDVLVNLSDGGHTGDNVGIYPLFQRRCKVIIACDAEKDAGLTFNSFTEALRHAYIDLGVDVDIDLSMIRPDPKTGLSRSHCAIGRIRYPDRPDQESFLIYLKNSLTGDEPEPMLNYKVSCRDFPHETTADQFFDDAQFESYRALGVHLAEHTFGTWVTTADFARLHREHRPSRPA